MECLVFKNVVTDLYIYVFEFKNGKCVPNVVTKLIEFGMLSVLPKGLEINGGKMYSEALNKEQLLYIAMNGNKAILNVMSESKLNEKYIYETTLTNGFCTKTHKPCKKYSLNICEACLERKRILMV